MNKGDLIYVVDIEKDKLMYINMNRVVSVEVLMTKDTDNIAPTKVNYRFHMTDNSTINCKYTKGSEDEHELTAQLSRFWQLPGVSEWQNQTKFDF